MASGKNVELSFEEVSDALEYVAETGQLIWKIAPNRRICAGTEAGIIKTAKPGKYYRYVTLRGVSTTAARFVWFLHNKEWVKTVKNKDGDTLNTRIENLDLPMFAHKAEMKNDRIVYKMPREAQRHYGLKRYYGISVEDYAAMLNAQDGVCAICARPETNIANGKILPLSVDHDHGTGDVRGLLCNGCNRGIGFFKDNRETLLSAIKYLDKHSGRAQEVSLRVVSPDKEGKRE